MAVFKQTPEWEQGQWGEQQVRRWFHEHGWYVVPVSCIEDGGAPSLTALLESRVLPDLQVAQSGHMGWVEVKTKTIAPFYQLTKQHRHGIDLRLWRDYLTVESQTGLPGHLAIIQREPAPRLLFATFETLRLNVQEYLGDGMPGGQPMAFFPVEAFDNLEVGDWGPNMPARIPRRTVHPWDQVKP